MASIAIILIGLGVLAGGICGILFVTVPSIYAIGDGIGSAVEGDGSKITGAVIGGVALWLTTGLFIFLLIIGIVVTLFGVVEN